MYDGPWSVSFLASKAQLELAEISITRVTAGDRSALQHRVHVTVLVNIIAIGILILNLSSSVHVPTFLCV